MSSPVLSKLNKLPANLKLDESHLAYAKAHHYKTPYLITDLARINDQLHTFQTSLPRLDVFYPVKSNDHTAITDFLKDKVDGFDVASLGEIRNILANGIGPERLLYSNPVKSSDAIKRAYQLGVRDFVFQSIDELNKLAEHAPHSRVYLRLLTHVPTNAFTFAVSNEKFGADPEDAPSLLIKAKRAGLQPTGLAFHVGSQMSDPKAWAEAIRACYKIIKRLERQSISIKIIDIGGGFPVNYGPLQPGCDFDLIARNINQAIAEAPRPDIKFIAEPGRYLVAESSAVVTSIISKEVRQGRPWLFVDISLFQAFMEKFGFNSFPFPVYSLDSLLGNTDYRLQKITAVTGPTCDSFDTLDTNLMLPTALKTGDRLIIGCAGAYGLVYAGKFNGFNLPQVHIFNSQKDT